MSIVFVRTRHEYGSYRDYWKLVEISDFETVYIDEVDLTRTAAYVFTPMNGEVKAFLENHKDQPRRSLLIWWFLERLDSTPVLHNGEMDAFADAFDAIWVSCRHMASMHKAFKHVILASDPKLGNDPAPIIYDFTHQSYATHRREKIYQKLKSRGLREGPNAWDEDRDMVLKQTATMVHVQQFEGPFYTPLRFALAAAYALAVVSEKLADPYPLDFLEQAPYDKLVPLVQRIAGDPGDRGGTLFQALCLDRTFRSEVEKSL